MACRVHHVNKKTGITYIYESVAYWDKEKKQARNKQVCIGKLDPVSGKFIPSKRLAQEQAAARDPAVAASAQIVGPSLILDSITHQLGLGSLLKSCFPKQHQQILTMVYYLVAQGGPLSHCEAWCKSHASSLSEHLTSQRISEILGSIGIDEKQTFLTKWMHKVLEDRYHCQTKTSKPQRSSH